MLDQRLADLVAETSDDVDDAVGKSCLLEQPAKGQRRNRGILRRFPDHRIAGGQRRRQLPCRQHQRRIPRRDCGDHAKRLFQRVVEHAGLIDRDDPALDLVGQATEVSEPLRHVIELHPHFADQLAVVAGLKPGQVFGFLGQQIGEAAQQQPTLRRRHRPPLTLKSHLGGFHRVGDIVGRRTRDTRPRLPGIGIVAVEGALCAGAGPPAPDKHVVTFDRQLLTHGQASNSASASLAVRKLSTPAGTPA
jgi:hypothetical protein